MVARSRFMADVESWWFRTVASPIPCVVLWSGLGVLWARSLDGPTSAGGRVAFEVLLALVAGAIAFAEHRAGPYGALKPLRPEHRIEVLRAVRHGVAVDRGDLHGYVWAFAEREQHEEAKRWFERSGLVRRLALLWSSVALLSFWAADLDARLALVGVVLGALAVVSTRAVVANARRRPPNRLRAQELAAGAMESMGS
jgi:hypothetical protein